MELLWLFLALQVKHFICDFPLQANPFFYKNKGTYGHAGGIAHAAIHGLGTWIILGWQAALLDAVVHYHIDWAKMRLNKAWKLEPANSEAFWILLGFDQLLHQLTYIALLWWRI
jgi:hypothetical protein